MLLVESLPEFSRELTQLDLLGYTIVFIEVLYRDDVRAKLIPLSLEASR
jgi:hypothetical protein